MPPDRAPSDQGRTARLVQRLTARRGPEIPPERGRQRTSAFVYGNITVLGAVLSATLAAVRSGEAVVLVAVTALTTFVAHIIAEAVSERVTPSPDRPAEPAEVSQARLRTMVRDSLPIATSALVPVLLYLAAALGWVDPVVAQLVAAGVVVLRLGLLGLVAQRISGRPASAAALWAGIGLAVLSSVIAVAKAVLGH